MRISNIEKLGDVDIVFDEPAIAGLGIDPYTLKDIEDSIRTPLRDYRDQFDGAVLRSDILELKDLKPGDELTGTVRNVVDFGAFIDIGLHDDGLVHISRMSERRIDHPSELLSVSDIVKVYVYDVDEAKQRVQLSLLPLDVLARREADRQQLRTRKKAQNRPYRKEKVREEPVNEEEAMKRLLERFGSKY